MSQLTLNLIQGSVSFNFTSSAAENLQTEINNLMQSLKEIALQNKTGGKPTPKTAMEYQYTGDVFLELFCNPNIYPSPFSAKVLVTLRSPQIRLTSEAELTRLVEDLEQYLQTI
ncbi:hypothetical protein [Cyanobacterium sp. Dongsha4]|uniref:hypothetical protein n=1 Tax=Cyanobacterium sp. DS4 TaxID=2878255 RepID=UPI002E818C81|nr:hypothetical protein [Cyanobacterium sp. Dongsha4]WVL00991.1 hypothetical protein Dongsha4_01990 [Cyanobacterium sp. Dongsha4]